MHSYFTFLMYIISSHYFGTFLKCIFINSYFTFFLYISNVTFFPPDIPSASLLICLLVVVVRSLCFTELPVSVCWLWVGLKGWVCLPSTPCEGTKVSKAQHTLSTIHQTWVHARRPWPRHCPSPFYPPPLYPWLLLTNPRSSPLNRVLVFSTHDLVAVER